jgi:hypothetical protein
MKDVWSVLGLAKPEDGRNMGRMLKRSLGLIGGLLVVRSVGCGGIITPLGRFVVRTRFDLNDTAGNTAAGKVPSPERTPPK